VFRAGKNLARRLNAPYFGKRYIGDSETKILHDVDKETPSCRIETIPRARIQMFEWLSIPSDMKYSGCKYCMVGFTGKSK
jgi:hypothetical protein